jgi:hypothetical protein
MLNAFAQTLNNILNHEERTWAEVFKHRVLRKIFRDKREDVTISKLEEKYKKKKKGQRRGAKKKKKVSPRRTSRQRICVCVFTN